MQVIFTDWETCSNPMQADIFRIWLPETLIFDNGPCYTAKALTSVMNAYHVNHISSSPHYPQSNGLAENYVQIVKSLFYKAKEEGKIYSKAL